MKNFEQLTMGIVGINNVSVTLSIETPNGVPEKSKDKVQKSIFRHRMKNEGADGVKFFPRERF